MDRTEPSTGRGWSVRDWDGSGEVKTVKRSGLPLGTCGRWRTSVYFGVKSDGECIDHLQLNTTAVTGASSLGETMTLEQRDNYSETSNHLGTSSPKWSEVSLNSCGHAPSHPRWVVLGLCLPGFVSVFSLRPTNVLTWNLTFFESRVGVVTDVPKEVSMGKSTLVCWRSNCPLRVGREPRRAGRTKNGEVRKEKGKDEGVWRVR